MRWQKRARQAQWVRTTSEHVPQVQSGKAGLRCVSPAAEAAECSTGRRRRSGSRQRSPGSRPLANALLDCCEDALSVAAGGDAPVLEVRVGSSHEHSAVDLVPLQQRQVLLHAFLVDLGLVPEEALELERFWCVIGKQG